MTDINSIQNFLKIIHWYLHASLRPVIRLSNKKTPVLFQHPEFFIQTKQLYSKIYFELLKSIMLI